MKIKWKKAKWTRHSESGVKYSESMLVRKSFCGNFKIYRWFSQNTYNVMQLKSDLPGEELPTIDECMKLTKEEYSALVCKIRDIFYFDAVNDPNRPFQTLNEAKEFCQRLKKEEL